MVLKRLNGLLGKRADDDAAEQLDTPEANAARGVRLFCESGGPNSTTEEIQYLPDIVTAAESSPAAAAACAVQIRKFLSKDYYAKPHVQYNAIMLIRILTDNPGPSFTKNLDAKFVSAVKDLLRQGRDPSVQQILRETLYSLDKDKAYDINLTAIFAMWRKEQAAAPAQGSRVAPPVGRRTMNAPPWDSNNGQLQAGGQPQSRSHSRPRGLPEAHELASRIEEARTSAKLLLQLIQSTPADELPANELIKEFAERCQQAQRSMQNYINAENPSPDDDTMLTLIETNEQLSLALSKHQRAVLAARRTISANNVPTAAPVASGSGTQSPAQPNLNGAPQLPYVNGHSSISEPSSAQSYAPTPVSPPTMQPNLAHRDDDTMKIAAPVDPSPEAEDPFADSHAGAYTYAHEPAPPPPPPPRQEPAVSQSYHPSYASTPSYLQRQESASANITMHGASQPAGLDDGVPDVSPLEERKPAVTYRY